MEEARRVLGPNLYAGIFARMPGQYRYHMLQVYHRARENGCNDPHVLQAALLHDSGKHNPDSGRYVTIPYRVGVVLLEATPAGRSLLGKLAQEARPESWRYPLYLHSRHPQLGAQRAARHGAHDTVVRLIADHHKQAPSGSQLSVLNAADEKS